MSKNRSSKKIISEIFFYSQLTALTLFGLATAYGSFEANEITTGGILVSVNILIIIAVIISALPNKLASITTLQSLIIITSLVSIFTLIFSYINASNYFELAPDFQQSPGAKNVRMAAFMGLGAFGLAFLVHVINVLSIRRGVVSD
jgi:hypothetical protein